MKSALITGASTGIGLACALRLDKNGWQVFAGVRKDEDAERIRGLGSERLQPLFIDVTRPESVASAVAELEKELADRGLDALVNNAGIAGGGVIEFLAIDELRRILEVNVVGVIAVTQPLIPLLRRAQGRIVMMSSIGGRGSSPLLGPYCASKFALEALTDSLRVELHPWNIEVVSVEPGEIDTPIWGKAQSTVEQVRKGLPAEAFELYGPLFDMMERQLQKVSGLPADAVAAVVEEALTTERPKTRYLVGRDAKVRIWIERLPDRLRDRIILSQLPSWGRDHV